MKKSILKADLHIHSVLSACASLDMSPKNIIEKAKELNIDVIAITDHNSCGNCEVAQRLGEKNNIIVLCGMEITVAEEFHVVALFSEISQARAVEKKLHEKLLPIEIDEDRNGYQLVVDEDENIIRHEKIFLNQATLPCDDVIKLVKENDGFFFFSHIDRDYYSILATLGFIPDKYQDMTFEIYGFDKKGMEKTIRNSDAHFIDWIGHRCFLIESKPDKESVIKNLLTANFYYKED